LFTVRDDIEDGVLFVFRIRGLFLETAFGVGGEDGVRDVGVEVLVRDDRLGLFRDAFGRAGVDVG
ncbi:hypothetical protein AAHH80_35295, partial [Burkholderia pseudomallei]